MPLTFSFKCSLLGLDGLVARRPFGFRFLDVRGQLIGLHHPLEHLLFGRAQLLLRGLDLVLHRATQRSSTQRRVEADLDETLLRRLRQLDRHVAVEQTLAEALGEQIDDLHQLGLAELREHDDVVDTVEELGLEVALELFLDLALHAVVRRRRVTLDLEPDRAARDVSRAQVRRHDDDRVLEVDDATLTVQTDHAVFSGADEIRRMFTDFCGNSVSIFHEIKNIVVEPEAGKVATEQGYIGELDDGTKNDMHNCNFFDVDADGKFSRVIIWMAGTNPLK